MRIALVGIGLLIAVSAVALSQEGPPPSAGGSGLMLMYTVVDLEANFPTVGPLVIPLTSLPPHHFHAWEASVPAGAPADGSEAPAEYRIHCRAVRTSADKMRVSAGVEVGGVNHTGEFDLTVAKDQCIVFRLPRGGQGGRFVFLYSLCEPMQRSAERKADQSG
ncbi:MAG: hypothetical protein WBD63_00505 [Phycisphaerae bacterium]|nr:hypothetical protein [Phycisphaerae bacterium]